MFSSSRELEAFMLETREMPNVNTIHNLTTMGTLVHNVQKLVRPVCPKTAFGLQAVLTSSDGDFDEIGLDYDQNQFYRGMLIAKDHTEEKQSYSLAFMSERVIRLLNRMGATDLSLFVDATFQTLPK